MSDSPVTTPSSNQSLDDILKSLEKSAPSAPPTPTTPQVSVNPIVSPTPTTTPTHDLVNARVMAQPLSTPATPAATPVVPPTSSISQPPVVTAPPTPPASPTSAAAPTMAPVTSPVMAPAPKPTTPAAVASPDLEKPITPTAMQPMINKAPVSTPPAPASLKEEPAFDAIKKSIQQPAPAAPPVHAAAPVTPSLPSMPSLKETPATPASTPTSSNNPPAPKSGGMNKAIFGVIALFIVMGGIIAALFVVKQNQDNQSKADYAVDTTQTTPNTSANNVTQFSATTSAPTAEPSATNKPIDNQVFKTNRVLIQGKICNDKTRTPGMVILYNKTLKVAANIPITAGNTTFQSSFPVGEVMAFYVDQDNAQAWYTNASHDITTFKVTENKTVPSISICDTAFNKSSEPSTSDYATLP